LTNNTQTITVEIAPMMLTDPLYHQRMLKKQACFGCILLPTTRSIDILLQGLV
jgi:hypothetical protein